MAAGYTQISLEDLLEAFEGDEDKVNAILSSFSCPLNRDVEDFLKDKALPFSRSSIAKTHLVFAPYRGKTRLVGYYALTLKSIIIPSKNLSSTYKRRLKRFGDYENSLNSYFVAAPLIGQLGKNYADGLNQLITGSELLKLALDKVSEIYLILGKGRLVYIECEDKPALVDFYLKNGFVTFGKRELDPDETDSFSSKYLIQMIKYLN